MNYSPEDLEELHRKYAPSDEVFDLVYTHCNIVLDIANQLIENGNFAVNADLIRVGCMVHDIGVHPLFNSSGVLKDGVKYITHGTEGEAILKNEGFPEKLWRFASHHTGVGLTKADVINQKLPLPEADYLAETDEELLVMYADKFHSKTTPPYFNSYEWYKNDIAQFGKDKVIKFEAMAAKFGVPDLAPLSKKYGFEIR
jgi:uncharacterized protein